MPGTAVSTFLHDNAGVIRARALAGIHGGRDPDGAAAALRRALARDGEAQTARHGDLVVGWVGERGPGEVVVDGALDVEPPFWDEEWLAHVRGDFLAVIPKHGLVARDQLGARTAYWTRDGGAVLFASHVRHLLGLLGAPPPPDEEALARWLAPHALPVDRTLFEGVHRLPAGHLLDLGAGAVRAYWRPHYERPHRMLRSAALATARGALITAVERRCTGDDTGLMLSGGVDSSAIAGVARHLIAAERRPARAYSAVFPEHPATDERERIRLVADATGLDLRELEVRTGSVLDGAQRYVDTWALPPVSPNMFFLPELLQRAAGDGTRVILDGEGGDEVFAAPVPYLADLLARGRLLKLKRLLDRAPSQFPHGLSARSKRHVLRTMTWPQARAGRAGGVPRWWTAYVTATITGEAPAQGQDHIARRAGMAGLLARHPLQDLDLIEALTTIPPEHHFDRRSRPLLRDAVAGFVPDEVRLRPNKSPFDSVFHDSLDGPDRERVAGLLADPDPLLRSLVDVEAVRRLQAEPEQPSGLARAHRGLRIWRVVTAQAWLMSVYAPT